MILNYSAQLECMGFCDVNRKSRQVNEQFLTDFALFSFLTRHSHEKPVCAGARNENKLPIRSLRIPGILPQYIPGRVVRILQTLPLPLLKSPFSVTFSGEMSLVAEESRWSDRTQTNIVAVNLRARWKNRVQYRY